MKIFSSIKLQDKDIDYTRWETFNGDYVKISDVGTSYIERSMDALEWHMQKYPQSENYPIWKHYMQVFEDELMCREYEEEMEDLELEELEEEARFYPKLGMPV